MNNTLINSLRNVRGADDIISRLQSNSLEARRDRIAEALLSSDFKEGPAELVATYPKHVLAIREGVLMRISLDEDEDKISFGKIEIYDVPLPAADIGSEIMETAKAAVDFIIDENQHSLNPMIISIANALDIKGNLHNQIESDVRLRSLSRVAWWQEVVEESYKEEVNLPLQVQGENPTLALSTSLDDLTNVIRLEAVLTTKSLTKLQERKDILPIYVDLAQDICEDMKTALLALTNVSRDSMEDMQKVYSTVGLVAPRLVKGSKFLNNLSNS